MHKKNETYSQCAHAVERGIKGAVLGLGLWRVPGYRLIACVRHLTRE